MSNKGASVYAEVLKQNSVTQKSTGKSTQISTQPRDNVRDTSRDNVRDTSRDNVRDIPRDNVRDIPRDNLRDIPRDNVRKPVRKKLRKQSRQLPTRDEVQELSFRLRDSLTVKAQAEIPHEWQQEINEMAHEMKIRKLELYRFIFGEFLGKVTRKT